MNSKLNENISTNLNSSSVLNENSIEEKNEELYTIPDEACCSPEFSQGCIIRE